MWPDATPRGSERHQRTKPLSWKSNHTSLLPSVLSADRESAEEGNASLYYQLSKIYHHKLLFSFQKAMVPSLRYELIVGNLHRLYHNNIIYPFRIYPNRFIYLGRRVSVGVSCCNCYLFFCFSLVWSVSQWWTGRLTFVCSRREKRRSCAAVWDHSTASKQVVKHLRANPGFLPNQLRSFRRPRLHKGMFTPCKVSWMVELCNWQVVTL